MSEAPDIGILTRILSSAGNLHSIDNPNESSSQANDMAWHWLSKGGQMKDASGWGLIIGRVLRVKGGTDDNVDECTPMIILQPDAIESPE